MAYLFHQYFHHEIWSFLALLVPELLLKSGLHTRQGRTLLPRLFLLIFFALLSGLFFWTVLGNGGGRLRELIGFLVLDLAVESL